MNCKENCYFGILYCKNSKSSLYYCHNQQQKAVVFVKLSDLIACREQIARENPGEREASGKEIEAYLRRHGQTIENLYQEMEMDSRYVDTHSDISYTKDVVQLHSHTFYELLYCCSGNLQYLLGADRYRLHRGDVVIVPPGVSHRPLFLEQLVEPYFRYVIWISPEFMDYARIFCPELDFGAHYRLLRTAGTPWESLNQMFARGCKEAERRAPGWQGHVCGNTLQLLVELKRACSAGQMPPPMTEKPELLDALVNYIEGHLAEKITLEGTARRFLVSQSTISQTFRQKMGISFYRFVTQRRLIAAKTEILAGKPLETLYETVGFSDYSTFFRAFRREYGISPSQYRKLQMPAAGEHPAPRG